MDNNWWVQDVARQHREQLLGEAKRERAAGTANTAQSSWLDRLSEWLGNVRTDHAVIGTANLIPKAKARPSR